MEKSCSVCSVPARAHSLCALCNKWLCYQCTDVHQHQRNTNLNQFSDLNQNQNQNQNQRPSPSRCPDLHPRGSNSLPHSGPGPGSSPWALLMCHSHRQQVLDLFCESCDLLCCSSCHLSLHKTHRVVQVGKALQEQQWLFESLLVQVEERRSAVESNAKVIEDRLHGVKIAHRKAENQIKMAKMIMMNELNKRANLLIEQLEKMSEDFQQRLEERLQGAIETCGQLDHVQKFISWATTQHCRGPLLFSRALVSLQMQQLLDSSLHSDSCSPIRIRFDWDASYWTKQISSLGQLTVDGGNCSYPAGLSCSSLLRPQPVSCLALPSVCHRGRDPGCGFQTCCEPAMCCLHGVPPQPDMSSLEKSQLEASLCTSSCVQPGLISASLLQNQQIQKCWDPESSSLCLDASSNVSIIGCSRGSSSQTQTKPFLYYQRQRDAGPEVQATSRLQRKLSTDSEVNSVDRDTIPEENWEKETRGQMVESRELLHVDLQLDRREHVQQQKQQKQQQQQQQQQQHHVICSAAEPSKDLQRNRPSATLRDHRDVRKSPSLEVSLDGVSDRLSPGLVCTRRERRSQSIPAELAAHSSSSSYSERPTGCAHSLQAGAAAKHESKDPKKRRSSDGVLCVVNETSSDSRPSGVPRFPLLSYKTEPDPSFNCVNEELDYEAKGKFNVSRNNSLSEVQRDRARVPVVCLERLKILVSQLPPPQGRRQSDPLPSGTHKNQTAALQRDRRENTDQGPANIHHRSHQTSNTEFDARGRINSQKSDVLSSSEPKSVLQSFSTVDPDPGSDPRSVSAVSTAGSDPHLDSDALPDSESSSDSDCVAEDGRCRDFVADSELEYEADPESEDGHEPDVDPESGESDLGGQAEAETDSDVVSDQNQDSPESELDLESEPEVANDEPQPLRSDLEEESHDAAAQRTILIANPQRESEPDQDQDQDQDRDQDGPEMESEDFCAVCLIGGDLLCCDRCPKVYHLSCHIPSLLSFPTGDWVCSLCRDVTQPEVQYDCENERTSGELTVTHGLPPCDQRKCERLTLLILSNVLSSPFHEPVSPLARHYYQIIKKPMDLSVIRLKLNRTNSRHYSSAQHFVSDVYLMFRNCAKFNYPDSEVAQAGRSLEVFFTSRLREVFPDRVFVAVETAAADSDSDEYDEAFRTESGFFWPEKREQIHRKRKRRNSLKSRRQHF